MIPQNDQDGRLPSRERSRPARRPPLQTRRKRGTLIQSALAGAADLVVTDTELRVVLAPLSSPHRTRALAALCEELDRAGIRFPGSRLRLRYAVASPG